MPTREELRKSGNARQGGASGSQVKPAATPIPVSLLKFPKIDVSFFLDRVPEMLKDRSYHKDFTNLFTLYLDGVLS